GIAFYHDLTDNANKVAFLESIIELRKDEYKKEELQKAYNSLPKKGVEFYYNLTNNADRVAFLESMIELRKDKRKKQKDKHKKRYVLD
ncbi:19390_t:CDS:2, partial [Dentiscutata erythropus]